MIWDSNEEVNSTATKYSVTLLHIACSPETANSKKLPTNACLVHYLDMKKGEEHYSDHYDIVMGNKVDIFDCYYDKLGKNKLKAIGWTQGNVSPGLFDKARYLKANK